MNKWASSIEKKVKSDGKIFEIPAFKLHVYPFFLKRNEKKSLKNITHTIPTMFKIIKDLFRFYLFFVNKRRHALVSYEIIDFIDLS